MLIRSGRIRVSELGQLSVFTAEFTVVCVFIVKSVLFQGSCLIKIQTHQTGLFASTVYYLCQHKWWHYNSWCSKSQRLPLLYIIIPVPSEWKNYAKGTHHQQPLWPFLTIVYLLCRCCLRIWGLMRKTNWTSSVTAPLTQGVKLFNSEQPNVLRCAAPPSPWFKHHHHQKPEYSRPHCNFVFFCDSLYTMFIASSVRNEWMYAKDGRSLQSLFQQLSMSS